MRASAMRSVAIEQGLCRSGRTRRPAWVEVRRRSEGREFKITGEGRGGKTVPLGHQEPISCDTECRVMVEPAPVATFKVSQTQLLFQLLITSFNDPTMFRHLDQRFELAVQRQRRYPVLGRLFLPSRPLDQQPFLLVWLRFLVVPMSRAYTNSGKAGSQLPVCAFPPSDFFEDVGG